MKADPPMKWYMSAIGKVTGSALVDGRSYEAAFKAVIDKAPDDVQLWACGGKLGDSEDSFVFLYTRIDPTRENFVLSATITASSIDGHIDQQSGYGLMTIDTDASVDQWSRHRNQLMAGCFGRQASFGVRTVSGYTDHEAHQLGGTRIVDESRLFPLEPAGAFSQTPHTFRMAKTDDGFSLSCDDYLMQIPGCDFLMQQDEHSLYVGFAAARGVTLSISDISIQISPGRSSHTPEGTLMLRIPDYPFPRALLTHANLQAPPHDSSATIEGSTIFAAPDGTHDGGCCREKPATIEDALQRALPGTSIVLADGVYSPAEPLVIPKARSGTLDAPVKLLAQNERRCIIDGSKLLDESPLFVLDADFWNLEGIVFRNSPLSGLIICGSTNRVRNCETFDNGDTGVLIISRPGASRDEWPQRNRISDCDSHDNCDKHGCNADGFGAKLRVGQGNVFYRCIAHHNIDDGFDLYSKYLYGPIEPVELDSCVAYGNGRLSNGREASRGNAGIGFKLGGERQPVTHEAWNSIAVENRQAGFSANSNPLCQLHFCTAAGNGASEAEDFAFHSAEEPRWVKEALLHIGRADGMASAGFVARRMPGGDIEVSKVLGPKRRHGKRLGASIGERKDILVLIASLNGGGAERVACKLSTALSERNNVSMMFFSPSGADSYYTGPDVRLIDASIATLKPAQTIPAKIRRRLVFKTRGVSLLMKERLMNHIDVTISLLETPNKTNALFGGKRKVLCERNDPQQKPKGYYERAKFNYRLADYVVFQSRKVQGQFSEEVRRKSCIIPNPVSVTCQIQPVSAPKVVTAGRLHPQKNHELLIRAFASFHSTHPLHTLHIFGEGDLKENLVALTRSLGVEHWVVFEGFCGDVHAAMSDAEMFVLSSDYEGLSNALIEAMMMGLPCISTACTGSDELITDGEDGLLVPVGAENDLCDAMARLADDADLRARLAYGARLRALDFAIDDVMRKWERIL